MEQVEKPPFILKLGGSSISHDNIIIDYNFLREFRDLLKDQIILGRKFALIIGGGQICRQYLDSARESGGVNDDEALHWIGTAVNTANAYAVRAFLGDDLTESWVLKFDDHQKLAQVEFGKPIVVAGGFKPGYSSDGVALELAKAFGSNTVIDLKNVAGVYSEDPKQNPNAKRIENLSWAEYERIIGNPETHLPGGNMPVDPIAAKEAAELGIKYLVLKAADFESIEAAIAGEEFTGTTISN